MATYYVDAVNGNDSNNGLGPDASHATNKPWQTLAKLLGSSGMASGDTAWLSPAGPFRETVTVAMTSATAETMVVGDPGNVSGFKTSGGVLVAAAPIIWTGYTTNDKTAPSSSVCLSLAARNFLTFESICFVSGSGATGGCVNGNSTTSSNIVFDGCYFHFGGQHAVSNPSLMAMAAAANTPLAWVVRNCIFEGRGAAGGTSGAIVITLDRHSADYDADVLVENCRIFQPGGSQSSCVRVSATGSGSGFGGGVLVRNCTLRWAGNGVRTASANLATSIPCNVTGCLIICDVGVNATTSGQITEDHNLIACQTARTNVTAGTGSIADGSYAALFHSGEELLQGFETRPYMQPWAGSPLLGFGDDGSPPTGDLFNLPRPAGGLSAEIAVGAQERGNTWTRETTTVRTGSNALSCIGPGYQIFQLPVDPTSTTVSIWLRYDSTYTGDPPKILVTDGDLVGVEDDSADMTEDPDTWEELTLEFTPTSAGIVTLILFSFDTDGAGKAFADDFSVS